MLPGRETIPRVPAEGAFTFAVFGDNQVYEFDPGPRFQAVIAAIDGAAPLFAVHVGDAIYSETNDREVLLRKWNAYRDAARVLHCPVVQTVGNHDFFDKPSSALWKDLWGEPNFFWDVGPARFVALDCESDPARLDDAQFAWLAGLLADSAGRHVFIFVHRPLFPVVGHIGDSLDEHPEDRDRLHALLAENRDRVRGVFHGHEHVFCHQDIDGVDYWHAAGSGSNLYAMPQQGGFYHFLMVRVSPDGVTVEARKVGTPPPAAPRVRIVEPDEVMETWESGLTWVTWDHTVDVRPVPEGDGLELEFDLARNNGPWLGTQAFRPVDLSAAAAISMGVTVPEGTAPDLRVTPSIHAGKDASHEGTPVPLPPGRNVVRLGLAEAPRALLAGVTGVAFSFSSAAGGPGRLLILNDLRTLDARDARLAGGPGEKWSSRMLWYAWNSEIKARKPEGPTEGQAGGLLLELDFTSCRQPHLYALPYPYLDLRRAAALEVEVHVPPAAGDALSVSLALEDGNRRRSPFLPLAPGWNAVSVTLDPGWLPDGTRKAVTRLEWAFASRDARLRTEVVLRLLRSSPRPA